MNYLDPKSSRKQKKCDYNVQTISDMCTLQKYSLNISHVPLEYVSMHDDLLFENKALHVKGISWDVHDTLGGQTIATQVFKNGVTKVASSRDSSAFVLQSDLLATNGVIHVIDNVI